MDYTQEQLDEIIAGKVSEAKKGLFTEEDLQRKVTSEVDRRVESGIQKGIETQKGKWEADLNAKAKLTAEELAQAEFAEQLKELTVRESAMSKRSNMLDAKDALSTAKIPSEQYDKFLDLMVADDKDVTKANVDNFVEMFNNTKKTLETQIKLELSNVPAPKTNQGDAGDITKDKFMKMGYAEKIKLKADNPEIYNKLIK